MIPNTRLTAAFLTALALAAPAVAPAQEQAATAPTADTVLARVGEFEITLGHVLVVRQQLPAQVGQLPDDVLFQGIIDQLIDQYLLSGELDGLSDVPESVALSLENERRALAASAVIRTLVAREIGEEEIKAAYDAEYADAEPEIEYNAAHILVATEEEAKEIVGYLEGGADFGALAEERSTDPSAKGRGGSLGWFGKGMMVPEFENAVTALEPGSVSAPVQTQFGWHVVKLSETREVPPPALEEVRDGLMQQIRQKLVAERIDSLRETAQPELLTEGIDPAVVRDDSILSE